jgi:hypothetical protein
MIIHLKNSDIDTARWDKCVGGTPGVKPYGYSWYLNIMSPGWEALVEDDYASVFPLPAYRKYGTDYLSTPVFTQRLGLFSSSDSKTGINDFLENIPDRFRLTDLCIGQEAVSKEYAVTPRVNYELDLSHDYDHLYDGFLHHCKRNIKFSAREQHDLVSDIGPEELVALFRKNKGHEIRELSNIHYSRLIKLIGHCVSNGKGRIVGARDTGKKLIFGIFLVESDGNRIMIMVVNTSQSREKMLGYYAVNELIKESAGTKTILDFEGSSIPSVASFMQSFGSRNVPYYRIYRNNLPWIIKGIKALKYQGIKALRR